MGPLLDPPRSPDGRAVLSRPQACMRFCSLLSCPSDLLLGEVRWSEKPECQILSWVRKAQMQWVSCLQANLRSSPGMGKLPCMHPLPSLLVSSSCLGSVYQAQTSQGPSRPPERPPSVLWALHHQRASGPSVRRPQWDLASLLSPFPPLCLPAAGFSPAVFQRLHLHPPLLSFLCL